MQKDFDNWNTQKKGTDARHARAPFREHDVWWCSLGANVGDEQDGKGRFFSRPILVIKKFNKHIFLGMPLSTILKEDNRFYHCIHFKGRDQKRRTISTAGARCKAFREPHGRFAIA